MAETILVEGGDGIFTVTVNRPDKLNALNKQVVDELTHAFEDLAAKSARVAILTGAGQKAFVAGADIAEMSALSAVQAKAFADAGHKLGYAIENAPFPVIAAVNGFALGGGCELALACDFIYAADTARFGQPEVNLGLMPGFEARSGSAVAWAPPEHGSWCTPQTWSRRTPPWPWAWSTPWCPPRSCSRRCAPWPRRSRPRLPSPWRRASG